MLFLLLTAAAYADTDLAYFNYPEGAEARFLMLKDSILRNIDAGDDAISRIRADYPDLEISRLEDLIDEMEFLVSEIDEIDLDDDLDELRVGYISIKEDARGLTSGFRATVHEIYPGAYDKLREQVRMQVRNSGLGSEIRLKVRQYNERRYISLLAPFHLQAEEGLIQRLRIGINHSEINHIINMQLRGNDVGELILQEKVDFLAKADEARQKYQLNKENRASERKEKIRNSAITRGSKESSGSSGSGSTGSSSGSQGSSGGSSSGSGSSGGGSPGGPSSSGGSGRSSGGGGK